MNPEDGSAGQESVNAAGQDPMIGQIIDGRYRVFDKLGEGGMGEVYAAQHVNLPRKVAIKLLRSEILTNEEAVSRFMQEARSASSIGHKNIIEIADCMKLPDGRVYLAMEFLEGAPLNDLIKEPQPAPRLIDILIQTGHGLAAAHKKGIVHRDMKPENVFVTQIEGKDVPKLLDFGIAKVSGADGNNHLTRTGTIFGTPFYMAPEQALGQAVDSRADVYAMGVIMYEVFTGSVPFEGESFMGILTQHITSEPTPPSQNAARHGRTIPPGVEDIIIKCMRKEPAERYQSMDELVESLIVAYRQNSGAGMSGYMEAHRATSAMQTPPPGAGAVHARSATIASPSPPPARAAATPMPYQQGQPSGPHGQPASASYPAAGPGPAHGYAPSASDSMVVSGKSKAPLIIALVVLLLAGGGVGAFLMMQTSDKDEAQAAAGTFDAGAAVTDNNGTVATTTSDAAPAIATTDAGTTAAAAIDAGSALASQADAAPVATPVKKVAVMIDTRPRGATMIGPDGVELGKTPKMIEVERGVAMEIKLERRGYREETITVDGSKREVRESLTRIKPDKPDKPDKPKGPCEIDPNSPKCICKKNPNHPVCELQ